MQLCVGNALAVLLDTLLSRQSVSGVEQFDSLVESPAGRNLLSMKWNRMDMLAGSAFVRIFQDVMIRRAAIGISVRGRRFANRVYYYSLPAMLFLSGG